MFDLRVKKTFEIVKRDLTGGGTMNLPLSSDDEVLLCPPRDQRPREAKVATPADAAPSHGWSSVKRLKTHGSRCCFLMFFVDCDQKR